jgi:hypothetical protein
LPTAWCPGSQILHSGPKTPVSDDHNRRSCSSQRAEGACSHANNWLHQGMLPPQHCRGCSLLDTAAAVQSYRARIDRSAKIGYNPRRSHAICPMLVGPNTVERRALDDPGRHIEHRPWPRAGIQYGYALSPARRACDSAGWRAHCPTPTATPGLGNCPVAVPSFPTARAPGRDVRTPSASIRAAVVR